MPPAPSPPPPGPARDRDAAPVPENIAQLLYVVRTLLEYGRHLAATIERRAAAPGFRLFAALFGTAKLPVILAYLHRGILRATALESLLLRRAATGRDLPITLPRIRSTPAAATTPGPGPDPVDQPLAPQIERLAAERAEHDAPIDPDHLPSLAEIEAQVRDRAVGRTITDICRDMGIVPGLCTSAFWRALMMAIASHEGSISELWQDAPRKVQQLLQEQEPQEAPAAPDNDPVTQQDALPPQQMALLAALSPERALGFRLGEPPVDPFPATPALLDPCRQNVPEQKYNTASPEATGPPPPAAVKRAA